MPPDAAHLPERFGLFTLILLGESVIAVMHGIEHQGTGASSRPAWRSVGWEWRLPSGGGLDVARATAERPVRSHADAVRLHLWSFAHLPLYLGLVVAFVGIQLVVSVAPEPALDARQMVILIASLGVVVVSLGAISRASRAEPCALPGAWRRAFRPALAGS